MDTNLKKQKIAMVIICTGHRYWPYVGPMIESARKYFLPNHEVDYLLWSDMPEETNYGATLFSTEETDWPYPTLMRYHLFLQQEEKLKEYDYIFYCDADMLFVDTVGDEILGEGITAAEHPMYHFRKEYHYPFELNPKSTAFVYIPHYYYAGGFQGGRSKEFIEAIKVCKQRIDEDFINNYTARWNDESHWNRYLYENPPTVILGPDYVYPDSLIKEYYEPLWGRSYTPKLITLTKSFTTSKEGGEAIKKFMESTNQNT